MATEIPTVSGWDAIGHLKPTHKLLLNHVIPKVAAKWHELGIELYDDAHVAHLEIIEKQHSNDIVRACTEMFKYWGNTYTNATWDKLIKALRAPGLQLNTHARNIMEEVVKAIAEEGNKDDYSSEDAPPVDNILNKKPEMADLNKIVVTKIMIQWEQLAEGFRYDDQVIASIKQQNRENPEECCRAFFRDWRGTKNGERVGPKTWSTLFYVIKEYTSIASDIREEMIAQVKKLSR